MDSSELKALTEPFQSWGLGKGEEELEARSDLGPPKWQQAWAAEPAHSIVGLLMMKLGLS